MLKDPTIYMTQSLALIETLFKDWRRAGMNKILNSRGWSAKGIKIKIKLTNEKGKKVLQYLPVFCHSQNPDSKNALKITGIF